MQDHPTTTRSTAKKAETAAVAPPCAMVIVGAAGDLTKRLVAPALYNLVTAKRLPDGFRLVGVDRSVSSVEEWRDSLTKMMDEFVTKGGGEFQADHIDQTAWRWLTDRMTYLKGDLGDPQAYRQLKEHLAGLDKTAGTAGNHLFYLAVPDRFFAPIVAALGKADLVTINNLAVSVQPGQGDGTFGAAQTTAVNSSGLRAIAAGEFNGDGRLDLVMSTMTSVLLLPNNTATPGGPVTFQAARNFSTGTSFFQPGVVAASPSATICARVKWTRPILPTILWTALIKSL